MLYLMSLLYRRCKRKSVHGRERRIWCRHYDGNPYCWTCCPQHVEDNEDWGSLEIHTPRMPELTLFIWECFIKYFMYVFRLHWITTLLRMWLSTSCISAFLSTAIAHSLTGLTTTHTCTGGNCSHICQMPITGFVAGLFLWISLLYSSFK